MKKTLSIALVVVMIVGVFAACTKNGGDNKVNGFVTTKEISVISREDGSGTRGAFVELFGIEEKNEAGEKIDLTTEEAAITDNTAVMMTAVASDVHSIGYISLGSLNDSVKALKIDGVAPSVETIKDGSYKISRPFNIATKGKVSDAAQDFINYIMSSEGQKVVLDSGYIPNDDTKAFESNKAKGKITIAGSSSVTPVMQKLNEAYLKISSDVEIEIQESDSTTGMNSVVDEICDIGMASRELKDSEIDSGLKPVVIAMDGIAVIANKENTFDNISSETIKSIYKGEILTWNQVK